MNGGFAIAAGLEQVIDYIKNLHFDRGGSLPISGAAACFSEAFLDYLRTFRFTGDIYAVPEGTPVFPHEPILTVRAPAIEAQLVETFLLLALNHQSLIATKANRVVRAAQGRRGAGIWLPPGPGRRTARSWAPAQPISAAAHGTACTISDQLYGVPAGGTMAHSWVQMFDSEYEAFKAYCQTYPDERCPAGGYLQHAQIRRARRHPRL